MSLGTILAFLLSGILLVWLSRRQWTSSSRTLPPGPRRTWLLGNLFDIPMKHMWLVFTEWGKKHGEIICLQALGNNIVVLNTLESVTALLDKKGNIYSNRPILIMAGELAGINRTLPLLQYGTAWRNQRKLTHLTFNAVSVKRYISSQEDIAAMYMQTLLDRPHDFMSELRLATGRIMMAVTYGLAIHSYDDAYIAEAEAIVRFMEHAVLPGSYMVDLIPALKYIPNVFGLVPFQTVARKYYLLFEQMMNGPFEHVKRDLAAGKRSLSFTAELLTNDDTGLDAEKEETIKIAAATMYGSGGDNTFAAILTFILAMVLFPEKQQKAQNELVRVVGSERLPNENDRPSLPYVTALVKETMRWRPGRAGLAHRSSQDDYYKGYFMPEGSLVMPNVWAISRDETIYESPEEFIPERFLKEDEGGNSPLDPHSYTFGFGRRICPGRYLADNSLYIFAASMLSTFCICRKLDSDKNEEPVNPVFTGGSISHPEPFKCRFIPRRNNASELIRNSRMTDPAG
ncbi:cytochrome P450 [Gautieria morchelliformis]|nr:cytochrome P450 [Gautieria morchelliformis]